MTDATKWEHEGVWSDGTTLRRDAPMHGSISVARSFLCHDKGLDWEDRPDIVRVYRNGVVVTEYDYRTETFTKVQKP